MYAIYSTVGNVTVCLHDDRVTDSRVKVVEPTLALEENSAGSLTFKLAPNNAGYSEYEFVEYTSGGIDPETGEEILIPINRKVNLVERMAAIITVYRTNQNGNQEELWEGRVLSETNDFNNLREIYCEGALAFLNDTIQPQREYNLITLRQFIEGVLNIHNGKVDDPKKFYVGQVTVDVGTIDSRKTDYGSTWDAISSIINDYKCHLRLRKTGGKRYLDFLEDYPNTNSQQIRLGSNLLDFTRTWNLADLATVVLPTGVVTQSATSSSVGEPLEAVSVEDGKILYVGDNDTVQVRTSSIQSYRVATYTLQADTNYYLSSRLHGGYVAYVIYTHGGVQHSYVTSGRSDQNGFVDRVDEKITAPVSEVGNTYTIKVCSWGQDISPTVKSEIPATQDFDQHLTVENVETTSSDGFSLLLAKPDDWETNYKDYWIKAYDNGYVHVSGDVAPEWVENTYYQYIHWHTKGSPYVINQPAVTKYGWIEKHLDFNGIETDDALYYAAKNYLESGQFDEMTIEISAVDLGAIGVDSETIYLLDYVRVISEPHGMNRLFPVTKVDIPLDDPAGQTFTLGYTTRESTISAASAEAVATISDKIAGIPSMSSVLASARDNATQLITTSQSGYITFIKNSDGQPIEMLITDELDYTQAQKVWRWNTGGFGYSSTGYNGQYNTAITMNGEIVANAITSGTMAAERIYGGTLSVGGVDNRNGLLIVYDASGNPICTFNNTGGNINGSFRTTGGGYFAQLINGRLIAGLINGNTDAEWGRFDARITVSIDNQSYHGLSLEADRTSGSDDTLNGLISLCAKRIVVAAKRSSRISGVGQTMYPSGSSDYDPAVRDGDPIPVIQQLSIETDSDTGETRLIGKGTRLRFINGLLVGTSGLEEISSVVLSRSEVTEENQNGE